MRALIMVNGNIYTTQLEPQTTLIFIIFIGKNVWISRRRGRHNWSVVESITDTPIDCLLFSFIDNRRSTRTLIACAVSSNANGAHNTPIMHFIALQQHAAKEKWMKRKTCCLAEMRSTGLPVCVVDATFHARSPPCKSCTHLWTMIALNDRHGYNRALVLLLLLLQWTSSIAVR